MNQQRFSYSRHASAFVVALLLIVITGCQKKTQSDPSDVVNDAPEQTEATVAEIAPPAFEVTSEQLLSARLTPEQAADGWIRLFDGVTLFGWQITGQANWRVQDGTIVVDQGDRSFLCTSTQWQDFELTLEFNADEKTNSGVFVRTPLDPQDPEIDCYEINIAPDDNPFPTASVVKRQKVVDDAPEQSFGQWRRMTIRVQGQEVEIKLDDQVVCQYSDEDNLPAGRISLQHNSGRVAFRDIRLKPIGLESLLDDELSQWKKYPDMPGDFKMTDDGALQVKGGRTQLESKQSFDDFVLLAEYKMADVTMNSGIFFRCIPGDQMMGYECQISNEFKDNNRLSPADCGTGGIFRRQDARVVAGDADQWATVVLNTHDEHIAAWVNGVQVSDWSDDREEHENPRKGKRLEAGTLMIQGHDPGTDALFRQFKITPIGG
ncbi:MAG: DUF1080 domain-containing protein [Pirellulaceae bacterium]|nr:DUF1080 domain-containing protein [Pirellulaceae bacterium]